MNDPNAKDDDGLLEELEEEFVSLIAQSDPRAVAYAIQVAAPLWAAREHPKRLAATQEMVDEWAEERAAEPPEAFDGPRRPAKRAEVVFAAPAAEVA